MSDAIAIPYRTEDLVPREGLYGLITRFAADRPMLAGFAGGLFANMLAFFKAPGVVESAPIEAAVLGLGVLLSWVVLFALMRPFFEAQAWRTEHVTRLITYNGGVFQWLEDNQVVKSLESPTFRIVTESVPPDILVSKPDKPWIVWVIAASEDGRFVLETKITAREASAYPEPDDAVADAVDEKLPTHVASPILILGRANR